ncbi:alpha-ketoglutarate-dependent dioxygenase AlkB [Tenacibaculum sp. M341]|uniref:alpha-ketoglutarate-dependent dioxygenase AlkB n=1 Tax=Tenacibaculum sp. M341 TaxID=2530339 RepID=UPI001053180A|nr:alpha-ketoglutarate-dependent dioxygenase AlkB [Tenacibaculum sp. M341]TCI84889.1 hypothetical protein EYW44_19320 [Tenacibaculum sp. M341]
MKIAGFFKIELPLKKNLFEELSNTVTFKKTGKGRFGNHLVCVSEKGIPMVRTTSAFDIPAVQFSEIHHQLIADINNFLRANDLEFSQLDFNNALIELYESNYRKMKYHSDQSLDLDAQSYVALFSCYENPEDLNEHTIRKLKIQDKITGEESEMLLSHNSVVLFSVATNKKYYHKIVLDSSHTNYQNRWLGVTFRKSKTFINIKNEAAYFENGTLLKLATEEERRTFFQLRGEENRSLNFEYPDLNYTISEGDLMFPVVKKM